jgi:hypothetical protein
MTGQVRRRWWGTSVDLHPRHHPLHIRVGGGVAWGATMGPLGDAEVRWGDGGGAPWRWRGGLCGGGAVELPRAARQGFVG